ncbi:MAG: S-layer homology domain-containing protein [Candidatus Nomurabacteria bacterium]|nr:S-layer homology domain-containing protein [Candidatus Nomurabacteria bacterium]
MKLFKSKSIKFLTYGLIGGFGIAAINAIPAQAAPDSHCLELRPHSVIDTTPVGSNNYKIQVDYDYTACGVGSTKSHSIMLRNNFGGYSLHRSEENSLLSFQVQDIFERQNDKMLFPGKYMASISLINYSYQEYTSASAGPITIELPTVNGTTPSFEDINDNEHKANIEWLYRYGITSGTTARTYSPKKDITRAQMATFLAKLSGGYIGDIVRFEFGNDVDQQNPHMINIAWLGSTGITKGCGLYRYCPDRKVTRAEMATFLYHFVGSPYYTPTQSELDRYDDVPPSNSHRKSIAWLAKNDITSTYVTYNPKGAVTREQMATFLRKLYDKSLEI